MFFENVLGKKEFVLLVHADWCGHCQVMKKDWKKAKQAQKKNVSYVVEMEHTVYTHFVNHHKDHTFSKVLSSSVSGFPCIVRVGVFQKGIVDINEFEGERVKDDFVKFMGGSS
jgi:thioredoxin-related protein